MDEFTKVKKELSDLQRTWREDLQRAKDFAIRNKLFTEDQLACIIVIVNAYIGLAVAPGLIASKEQIAAGKKSHAEAIQDLLNTVIDMVIEQSKMPNIGFEALKRMKDNDP